MIEGRDVYEVVVAMVPLYVALGLGYGSVKWRRMFNSDQCDTINRFNCYFIMPFFTFQFAVSIDPYHMNFRFLGGDVMAKTIMGIVLALWANLWREGNLSWAITSYNLLSMSNTLVVGVPLLKAMYGPVGADLVVQSLVIQSLIWLPILLFLLEFRRTFWVIHNDTVDLAPIDKELQIEDQNVVVAPNMNNDTVATESRRPNFGSTMKKVCIKLAKNPNSYACALGVIWAVLAKRWHFEMPSIVDGSIQIMAKGGSGVAMFTIGLFMALQEKVIACGVRVSLYAMVMRFVVGPLTTALGSYAFGLRSNILRITIMQAALPQSIASFVFAQEYGLHTDVISTAVIFGTILSLPLLIAYYVMLDVVH